LFIIGISKENVEPFPSSLCIGNILPQKTLIIFKTIANQSQDHLMIGWQSDSKD
jgi:hypothetical protein